MSLHLFDVDDHYWVGDPYETESWKRFTLFYMVKYASGGSNNWPIAEIDIVQHPSMDGCNPHTEVKISIRNNIRRVQDGIEVDKNSTKLRHMKDIVDNAILDDVVTLLIEGEKVSEPYSVHICMQHVESFRAEGDFWRND